MIHLAILLLVAGAASLGFVLATAIASHRYRNDTISRRIAGSRHF